MGWRLQRVVRLDELKQPVGEDRVPHEMGLQFAVLGRGGAVSWSVLMGNHRNGRGPVEGDPPYTMGPLGMVSRPEEMVVADMASNGLHAHGHEPWPLEPDSGRGECTLLGSCYTLDLEGPSMLVSTPMLMRLCQPGGLEASWDVLEEKWRELFVPELGPRAAAREAARLADARAEGAARASGERAEEESARE